MHVPFEPEYLKLIIFHIPSPSLIIKRYSVLVFIASSSSDFNIVFGFTQALTVLKLAFFY